MRPRLSPAEVVRGLSLWLAVALLIPTPCARGQGTQVQGREQAEVEPLLKEILSVIGSGGEEGLRAWMKTNKDRVGTDLIATIVGIGKREREESILRGGVVLAEEKGDETFLAAVYSAAGVFYFQIGNNSQAMTSCQKAMPIWRAVGDRAGEGVRCTAPNKNPRWLDCRASAPDSTFTGTSFRVLGYAQEGEHPMAYEASLPGSGRYRHAAREQ
jgi:hypothetical protein